MGAPDILKSLPRIRAELIEKVFSRRNPSGLWKANAAKSPLDLYRPKQSGTFWTLLALADLGCDPADPRLERPVRALVRTMFFPETGVFGLFPGTYGSHEPSPCINGLIVYMLSRLGKRGRQESASAMARFAQYQRFDDGGFQTPAAYPYYGAKDHCYSRHTCFWGVIDLLRAVSFLPGKMRTPSIEKLKEKCVDFILLHEVCFSSRKKSAFINPRIRKLRFPISGDFLQVLWLLKREGVKDRRMRRAIRLLLSRRNRDGTWNLEATVPNGIVTFGKVNAPNPFITEKALYVLG